MMSFSPQAVVLVSLSLVISSPFSFLKFSQIQNYCVLNKVCTIHHGDLTRRRPLDLQVIINYLVGTRHAAS